MVEKWCGRCGNVSEYDITASYCINCGARSLDYTCTCGRTHVGGMPCHCEPPVENNIVDQYQTKNLHGMTLAQFTTARHLWKEKGIE